MKVKFYLLRPDSKTETALRCSISFKNERLRVGIDESINPKFWNRKTHCARFTPSFPSSPEFNQRLENIKAGIKKCYYDNFEEGNPPTIEQLKTLILNSVLRKGKNLTFFDFYQDFITKTLNGERHTANGTVVSATAAKHYKTAMNVLKEFNPKLNFNDITLEFYAKYLQFLNAKGLSSNTIGDHVKRLKAIMASSLEAGHHSNESFKSKSFIKPNEKADNIYLSLDELKEIERLSLEGSPHLDRVRDLFLIGCFTGLRFSDYSRLTPQHIEQGFITIEQAKTGESVVIPVHSVVKKIIEKYNGNLPPTISNQKFNDNLKEICKRVECLRGNESKKSTKGGLKVAKTFKKWEMVSSHTARRSFATNEYLKGTPTLTIMKITGHQSEKVFFSYIKVSPHEHAEKMKLLWEKRESKLIRV